MSTNNQKPNIILCMTDDQGYGDTGYQGHPHLRTPNLDKLSNEGVKFNRWYAGAPVCSPTRGSCLTGRHPYRYGIFFANVGHMPKEEVTLAEALKTQGYTTGHFGKWHLGTLTTKMKDSNRGKKGNYEDYSPPWENGFDICFSTEAKVPTYNPMISPPPEAWPEEVRDSKIANHEPGTNFGTYYWEGEDQLVEKNLEGDDSKLIMDRALPFIKDAVEEDNPFLAVIWFHSPHLPVLADSEVKNLYKGHSEFTKNYYGCLTAMDKQIGRLRKELKKMDVFENTMFWFCSDNGPEDNTPGTTAGLRGRKRSLYEGGIRVPGFLVWPDRIKESTSMNIPCSTNDYFPTVLDALGFKIEGNPEPIDGESLLPLIEEKRDERINPIGFESKNQITLMNNKYKLISTDKGETYELYDIISDPKEENDILEKNTNMAENMKNILTEWRNSCKKSLLGEDY